MPEELAHQKELNNSAPPNIWNHVDGAASFPFRISKMKRSQTTTCTSEVHLSTGVFCFSAVIGTSRTHPGSHQPLTTSKREHYLEVF